MTPKLVARAIVFLVAFVAIAKVIESSDLVAMSVESKVASGAVAETAAPRVAALLEYGIAAVLAVFACTHTIGDKAADLLVGLWGLVRSKVRTTYEKDSQAPTESGLDSEAVLAFLTELDARVKSLETARKRSTTR